MEFNSTQYYCTSLRQLLLVCLLLFSVLASAQEKLPEKGWIKLFNGKDIKDWVVKIKGHKLNDNFGNTFRVQDGKLIVSYDQYKNWDRQYGHIFYKKKFSAYLLVLEYRFTGDQIKEGEGWAFRNSGAMLHSQDPATISQNQDFPISLEMQLLGGNGKDKRTTGNLCTPGTNVFINNELYTDHCINSSSQTYHGDQWVKAEALVLGDSIVKHIVRGDTVLSYTRLQIDGRDPNTKASYQDKQPIKDGYISLQSESHPVEFRKVELFNLEKYMDDPNRLQNILHLLHDRRDH
jgi:hypothetical protein